jgi:sucrose-6-phosphate hydrolase SacC (GH32 family)
MSLSPICAQKQVLLFSYFTDNGEDGLHLAYSHEGYEWKKLSKGRSFLAPEVGKDKLMRDPCIIVGPDKKFHMVWTISWKEKGIGYAYSENLTDWSVQKLIPVMKHEEEAKNCWAPEVYYDKSKEIYLIFWSTTIPGRFPDTDDSGDNGLNHRMYYVTTRDFEEFSETKLLYNQGFNVIDGTLTKHIDKYYMFLKDETRHPPEKNIRIAVSHNLFKGYGKPTEPITGDYWAEGPTVIKFNNQWWVYFDKYRKNHMGAVISEDLINWKDISHQISFPKGTRHGSVFIVSEDILKTLLEEK